MSTQFAHDFHWARMAVFGISSRPNLGNSNLSVAASIPMDHEHDLIRRIIIVNDDFLNQEYA